jgi:hypothetical protein
VDVEKGFVMIVGVAVRFVSVDKRRRRDVVLSIEELGVMYMFDVNLDGYFMLRRSTSHHPSRQRALGVEV